MPAAVQPIRASEVTAFFGDRLCRIISAFSHQFLSSPIGRARAIRPTQESGETFCQDAPAPRRDSTGRRAGVRYSMTVVRSQEQRRRDREAERLGGLEVDDQLELGGLLDGQVGGLGALENREACSQTASRRVWTSRPRDLAVVLSPPTPAGLGRRVVRDFRGERRGGPLGNVFSS